jgi:hypothetical protein
VVRGAALAASLLALAASCSSSHHAAGSSSPTTTNPLATPNSIPYEVGERMGLPNGWIVEVTKVHQPYVNPSLPAPRSGREYVAVDVMLQNRGSSRPTLDAGKVFSFGDSDGKVDPVIPVPGQPNGLDGVYPPTKSRTGRLVFDVPSTAQLRMAMNGPLIGTQYSIFTIVPPKVGPGD